MSQLRPFQALRPHPDKVSQVAAVPYDVVNRMEAFEMAKQNPWNFLHISRPEIDLPLETDPYSKSVYQKGARNFQDLLQRCPFIQEEVPALYLYRLRMGPYEQTGIVGSFSIDEYDSNIIKKHEKTRKDKEDDRTNHILELKSQTGPVFLTFQDVTEIQKEMQEVQKTSPIYDFTTSDEITHTVWKVANPIVLSNLFQTRVPKLYIADGHHRAAAASRTRAVLAKNNLKHTGSENYNYFMAVAFPGSHLRILPYHRVVKDLLGMTQKDFLSKLGNLFEVSGEKDLKSVPGEFRMYIDGHWYRLVLKKPKDAEEFDVSILQNSVLDPILGIQDPRTDKRIEFVGGIRGTKELEKIVNSGEAQVAFAIHPIELKDLIQVADQGGIMPPKSTWFEPKLRDGVFCHNI